jgi:hypothetical protein
MAQISSGSVQADSNATPHSIFAQEIVAVVNRNSIPTQKTFSTVPFSGFFVRYCRDQNNSTDIARVRFGKQSNWQGSGWITIGEGFSCSFAGGNTADVIEFDVQKDSSQPLKTLGIPTTICAILVAAGSTNSSGGF